MESLLYFALFAGLFFLMMRFGCGAHVMHRHGRHEEHDRLGSVPPVGADRWVPPATAIDPVCEMTVNTATAKSSIHDGTIYYFCSAKHREQFEANPQRYTRGRIATKALEHNHG